MRDVQGLIYGLDVILSRCDGPRNPDINWYVLVRRISKVCSSIEAENGSFLLIIQLVIRMLHERSIQIWESVTWLVPDES